MAESNFLTSIGKGETMDISETAAASGMKIGRYRQLMKVSWYLRSRSSLAPGPRSYTYEN